MSKNFRLSFLLGGILCCLTLVGYSSNSRRTSDGAGEREELHTALGIPFSPWYESRKTIEDGRLVSSEWHVDLLSWSWVVFLAGIGALVVWWRARPEKGREETLPGNP